MLIEVHEIELQGFKQAFLVAPAKSPYHRLTQRWRTRVETWGAAVLPQISTRHLEALGPKGLILRWMLLEPEEYEALDKPRLSFRRKKYAYEDYQHWIFNKLMK